MEYRKYTSCILCFVLAGLSLISGAVGKESANPNNGEAAIRAAAADFIAATRRGDAESLKKMWTADGDYVDASGQAFKAQNLIRAQVASSRFEPGATNPDAPTSNVRLITPDVAIEDGAYHCGVSGNGSMPLGRFTAVWVQRDGRWLIDSLREATSESPPFNEKLQPLEWLLGEWVGTTDDAVILISSHWSDDGKYISREFLVRGDGSDDISATQRIGWDASAGKIRCWTFDSQGGTSEGVWRLDGERWIVDSTEVLADGRKSKSSSIYTPGEDGRFASEMMAKWNTGAARAEGAELPTLRVEFKRAMEEM